MSTVTRTPSLGLNTSDVLHVNHHGMQSMHPWNVNTLRQRVLALWPQECPCPTQYNFLVTPVAEIIMFTLCLAYALTFQINFLFVIFSRRKDPLNTPACRQWKGER